MNYMYFLLITGKLHKVHKQHGLVRVLMEEEEVLQALHENHNLPTGGHAGRNGMMSKLNKKLFFKITAN